MRDPFGADPFWNLMEPLNCLTSLRDNIIHLNDLCISVLAKHCKNLFNNGIFFFQLDACPLFFLPALKITEHLKVRITTIKTSLRFQSLSLKGNIKKSKGIEGEG